MSEGGGCAVGLEVGWGRGRRKCILGVGENGRGGEGRLVGLTAGEGGAEGGVVGGEEGGRGVGGGRERRHCCG